MLTLVVIVRIAENGYNSVPKDVWEKTARLMVTMGHEEATVSDKKRFPQRYCRSPSPSIMPWSPREHKGCAGFDDWTSRAIYEISAHETFPDCNAHVVMLIN